MTDPVHVTILHGNDEFAIAAAIDKLCAGLGDPATADMNIARFDGRLGLDFEALNTAVNAAPFLAPRRVMVRSKLAYVSSLVSSRAAMRVSSPTISERRAAASGSIPPPCFLASASTQRGISQRLGML